MQFEVVVINRQKKKERENIITVQELVAFEQGLKSCEFSYFSLCSKWNLILGDEQRHLWE